jgi:pyrimidine operon attenuation protein / uracil phosphoribosyltransferase
MATKKKRVLILDKEHISFKLRRMAYEIWEHNSDEKEIILVGIDGGGKTLAHNLTTLLKKISPLKVKNIPLSINKKNPAKSPIELKEDLTGCSVILVDDVVNSGKTIMYSLNAILSYDLKKLMVAVLVDRKHKSFPIASDIVGHTIATTLQEHIEVETEGNEIIAAYLE